jgi:serine/threonine protein kinase
MGEMWKARDTRLERTIVVKVLPSHLSASSEACQRLEREVKTISQFSHLGCHIFATLGYAERPGRRENSVPTRLS